MYVYINVKRILLIFLYLRDILFVVFILYSIETWWGRVTQMRASKLGLHWIPDNGLAHIL